MIHGIGGDIPCEVHDLDVQSGVRLNLGLIEQTKPPVSAGYEERPSSESSVHEKRALGLNHKLALSSAKMSIDFVCRL